MSLLLWGGVLLAGGTGSVLRFLVDSALARRVTRPFPIGTLAVNISGAALLGFLSGIALSHTAAVLVGVALIGSYTTFSTWMLETQRLGEERQIWPAIGNLVMSVTLGLAAVLLGQAIAGWL